VARRATLLPECEVVRVTRKRFRALLISDALRWTRGDVVAAPTRLHNTVHQAEAGPDDYHTRQMRALARGSLIHLTPTRRYWHPPQLNSDYPGMNAYSHDDGAHDYEED